MKFPHIFILLFANIPIVFSQTCTYTITHSNIASNTENMAESVVPILLQESSLNAAVEECKSHCNKALRLTNNKCDGFSLSPTKYDTCYLYQNLDEDNFDLTGNDRLYKSSCGGGGGGSTTPVDCVHSNWSSWGSCSATCGTGRRSRSRTIQTPAKNGGAACSGSLTDTENCNTQACPVVRDCVVSSWTSWSSCPVTCGTGYQSRSRSVLEPAQNGGSCNDPLTGTKSCDQGSCSVDCQVSNWGQWSSCSAQCGPGRRSRSRSVVQSGDNCPQLNETEDCNLGDCPSETCEVSEWAEWSECSESCGSGIRYRSRSMTQGPTDGSSCPDLLDWEDCNESSCSSDCVVSDWSPWGDCSASCGTGTQWRSRHVTQYPSEGACPHLSEDKACNKPNCRSNSRCEVSSWTYWSGCSSTCGAGYRSRSREVTQESEDSACPNLYETKGCFLGDCWEDDDDEDCFLSQWNHWSSCSVSCGTGEQRRSRRILKGGFCDEDIEQVRTCSKSSCGSKSSCSRKRWSSWSRCSVTCGYGQRMRYRMGCYSDSTKVTKQEEVFQSCKMAPCIRSSICQVSEWTQWQPCSESCGWGKQTKTRVITNDYEGKCPYSLQRSKPCKGGNCSGGTDGQGPHTPDRNRGGRRGGGGSRRHLEEEVTEE